VLVLGEDYNLADGMKGEEREKQLLKEEQTKGVHYANVKFLYKKCYIGNRDS